MAEPARIFDQPHERTAGLHALGLEEERVRRAVIRGLLARRTCTPFDPPSFPGTVQWARTIRAMRELHVELGWTASDANNFSRIIDPNGEVAVSVATGDGYTGVRMEMEPRTRYPKGTQTKLAVDRNAQQLGLFPETGAPVCLVERRLGTLWMLLLATTAEQVRFEISRPSAQDEKGHVVAWSERIICEAIEIETVATEEPGRRDVREDEVPAEIDVPVERI
jgi:hypothetical protein